MLDKAAVSDDPPLGKNTQMQECDEIDWASWALAEGNQRTLLENQLRTEIGPEHQLFDRMERLRVTARDNASDNILVADPTEKNYAFIVHLMWSEGPSIGHLEF